MTSSETMMAEILKANEHMKLDDRNKMLAIILEDNEQSVVSVTGTGCAIILENCKPLTIEKLHNFIKHKKYNHV